MHRSEEAGCTPTRVTSIVIDTTTLDTLRRHGEVIEVIGQGEREHYRVRWQDGDESVYFRGRTPRGVGGLSVRSGRLPDVTRGPGAVHYHDTTPTCRHERTVSAAVCCGAILLAMAIGYLAGTDADHRGTTAAPGGTAAPPLADSQWDLSPLKLFGAPFPFLRGVRAAPDRRDHTRCDVFTCLPARPVRQVDLIDDPTSQEPSADGEPHPNMPPQQGPSTGDVRAAAPRIGSASVKPVGGWAVPASRRGPQVGCAAFGPAARGRRWARPSRMR